MEEPLTLGVKMKMMIFKKLKNLYYWIDENWFGLFLVITLLICLIFLLVGMYLSSTTYDGNF